MDYIFNYLSQRFSEISPLEFYREIFPEGELQRKGEMEEGKYNAIAIQFVSEEKRKRFTITDDLALINELIEGDYFTIIAPVSYAGKERVNANARFLYALAFDLDGIGEEGNLNDLFHQFQSGHLPRPTFVVQSGNDGLHLYYQFIEPVPCFNNIKKQISRMKRSLTDRIWNEFVTTLSNAVQFQSAFQGFRMVGSKTKQGNIVRAFRTGEPVRIHELNAFVPEKSQVLDFAYKSKLTLKKAKEKYPDWYERRIVRKEKPGRWVNKRALYDWWLRRMPEIKEGHRYHALMCLAVYAKKCEIPKEELERDAYGLIKPFEGLTTREDNHFTKADVKAALLAYDEQYVTLSIREIEDKSGLRIDKNKRNGRKQKEHLKGARALQEIYDPDWRNKEGRPSKKNIIEEYLINDPEAKPKDIIQGTGISKNTVYKHYNSIKGKNRKGREQKILFSAKSSIEVQRAFEQSEQYSEK